MSRGHFLGARQEFTDAAVTRKRHGSKNKTKPQIYSKIAGSRNIGTDSHASYIPGFSPNFCGRQTRLPASVARERRDAHHVGSQ